MDEGCRYCGLGIKKTKWVRLKGIKFTRVVEYGCGSVQYLEEPNTGSFRFRSEWCYERQLNLVRKTVSLALNFLNASNSEDFIKYCHEIMFPSFMVELL